MRREILGFRNRLDIRSDAARLSRLLLLCGLCIASRVACLDTNDIRVIGQRTQNLADEAADIRHRLRFAFDSLEGTEQPVELLPRSPDLRSVRIEVGLAQPLVEVRTTEAAPLKGGVGFAL